MIKSTKLLVVDKTDIQRQSANKEKITVEWLRTDLRQKSHELFNTSDMVIGVGEKGETIVLKNRWGISGVVVSHEEYNKFIKPRYENNKPGNTSEKKSFLGRIFNRIKIFPFN